MSLEGKEDGRLSFVADAFLQAHFLEVTQKLHKEETNAPTHLEPFSLSFQVCNYVPQYSLLAYYRNATWLE